MSQSPKIIVVAGASGKLGGLLCEAILERAKRDGEPVIVRALVRKGRDNDRSTPNLTFEPVDYESDADLLRVCAGAYSVISTLQGVENVIIGVQSRLLKAAIAAKVRRFVPSDFSYDFTKLPVGSQRNFDLRRRFHEVAATIIATERSAIEFTSVFQGVFAELLGSGWMLFDYNKRQVSYFGSPDNVMEFTTWKNTAEFTAAVALDPSPTPKYLHIAGRRLTPKEVARIGSEVTGVEFKLKRQMSVRMLGWMISIVKLVKPGKKDDPMPLWVGMQYAYAGALGLASPKSLDNDRYDGIEWTGVEGVIKAAFQDAQNSKRPVA